MLRTLLSSTIRNLTTKISDNSSQVYRANIARSIFTTKALQTSNICKCGTCDACIEREGRQLQKKDPQYTVLNKEKIEKDRQKVKSNSKTRLLKHSNKNIVKKKGQKYSPLPKANYEFISFDMEMKQRKIRQLGAVSRDKIFCRHIINHKDSKILRIRVNGRQNGDLVVTKHGLLDFIAFMEGHIADGSDKKCVLFAHHARGSDAPVLVENLMMLGMVDRFKEVCAGFSDTLPLFRAMLPTQPSYRQEDLVASCLGIDRYLTHDAELDAIMLSELVHRKLRSRCDLLRIYSFDVDHVVNRVTMFRHRRSYKTLVDKKLLSRCSSTNLAEAGVNLQTIADVYRTQGKSKAKEIITSQVDDEKAIKYILEAAKKLKNKDP